MRKTKKWLALSMAAVMTAMTGCSGSQSGATADASKTAETQTVTPESTAEEKTENSAAEIAKERNDELGFELYGEDGTTRKRGALQLPQTELWHRTALRHRKLEGKFWRKVEMRSMRQSLPVLQ